MKKAIYIFLCLLITTLLQAQTTKTVNETGLSGTVNLTTLEKNTITDLYVTDTITKYFLDEIDSMPNLKFLDLSAAFFAMGSTFPFNDTLLLVQPIFPINLTIIPPFNVKVLSFKGAINSVTIPASIPVGVEFYNCKRLKAVTFQEPSMVTFSGYEGLMPNIYTVSGGGGAFNNCDSLKSITIPSSIKKIGTGAFWNCKQLKTVSFHSQCKIDTIGYSAFLNCDSLQSITIPASVVAIEASAFSGCYNLETVNIENNSKLNYIGGSKDYSYIKDLHYDQSYPSDLSGAFSNCRKLHTFKIPSTVTYIGELAFNGCFGGYNNIFTPATNTTKDTILIPKSVVHIGRCAFLYCGNIAKVLFEKSSHVDTLRSQTFQGCTNLDTIEIPASVKCLDNKGIPYDPGYAGPGNQNLGPFIGCEKLKLVTYENNSLLDSIKGYSFYKCSQLDSIIIPPSVKYIGDYAFCNTGMFLKKPFNFESPSSLTYIGDYAFQMNSSGGGMPDTLIIPNTVTHIGQYAFSKQANIKSVIIPSSVTEIGSGAFSNCYTIKEFHAESFKPIDLSASTSVFDYTYNNGNTALYVPDISIDLYKKANQWKDFNRILGEHGFWFSDSAFTIASTLQDTAIEMLTKNTWTVKSDQSWLTVSPSSGTGSEYLTINTSVNTDKMRSAKIIFTANGVKDTIVFIQKGSGCYANPLTLTFDTTYTPCGTAKGTATANVTGGTSPYSYKWSNGVSVNKILNVAVGIYDVTITDTKGCTIGSSVTIADTSNINFEIKTTNVWCIACSGMVVVKNKNLTDKTLYSFKWSNGSNNDTIFNVCEGKNTILITRQIDGCSNIYRSITKKDKSLAITTHIFKPISSTVSTDGVAYVSYTDNVNPITFKWSNGGNDSIISNVGVGKYYVTVSDGVCTLKDSVEFKASASTVNKVDLLSTINTAQLLYDSSNEGTSIGEFPIGSKVILKSAKITAQTVYDNISANQGNVDNAVITLNKAISDFKASQITEFKPYVIISNPVQGTFINIDSLITINATVNGVIDSVVIYGDNIKLGVFYSSSIICYWKVTGSISVDIKVIAYYSGGNSVKALSWNYVNKAPNISKIAEQIAGTDKLFTPFDLKQYITDDNTKFDLLKISFAANSYLDFNISNGLLKATQKDKNWTGSTIILISATDEQGITMTDSLIYIQPFLINASNNSPSGNFSSNKMFIKPSQIVRFNTNLYSTDTVLWDFSGGKQVGGTYVDPYVQFDSVGAYTISMTIKNKIGQSTITKKNYIVISRLNVIDTIVCKGNPITIEIKGNSFNSFSWNTNPIQTTQSITVKPLKTTTYKVSYKKGVALLYDSVTIFIAKQPDFGNDTSFCDGKSLKLNPGVFSKYFWNNSKSNGNQFYTATTSGKVKVQTIDSYGCIGFDSILIGTLYQKPKVNLGKDSTFCWKKKLILNAGNSGAIYKWMTGATSQTILADTTKSYIVTVTDSKTCSNSDTINIKVIVPIIPNIGVITQSSTNKNIIAWEPQNNKGIKLYHIWKENSGSKFEDIKTIYKNDSTYSIDNASNPIVMSNRYALSSVDSACGNESYLSPVHGSMHLSCILQKDGTVKATWNNYEGIPVSKYIISRAEKGGKLQEYTTVTADAGDYTTYIDNKAIGLNSLYRVSFKLEKDITPSALKADSGPFSVSLSNMAESELVSILIPADEQVTISPNPANDIVTIAVATQQQFSFEIVDILGRVVVTQSVIGSVKLDCSSFIKGVYFVKVFLGDSVSTKTLVME